MNKKYYYNQDNFKLLHGDALFLLKKIELKSIDMIFADPQYFLSGNGITCSGGKMVSVNKGDWDSKISVEEKHKFNRKWIKLCYKVLKDDGTIWISGTMHNIYSIGMALEQEGFKIINNITWRKTNPPPNISCRAFVHSTETILWAKKDLKKSKYYFNYNLMKEKNNNKQMKDVWETSLTKPSEKKCGKHPTQKPEVLLENVILASTKENDLILDPFNGSGTTGIVANRLNRRYIGIEKEYLDLTIKRKEKEENEEDFNTWLSKMKPSLSDYTYYVDFNKIYKNVDNVKIELNILNALIGSKNIEKEFQNILIKYPETSECIPLLLAVRSREIFIKDEMDGYLFKFDKMVYSIEDYVKFMRESGLFDLLQNHIINNLYDYVLGIEVGLDSNGRINRGGHLMENLVESYI